jgi:hypothetical protein
MPTQIADVIVPQEFSAYVAENSLVSTALFESGVLARNPLIDSHLAMGSNNFNVPFWLDLGENDPNITNDNPAQLSTRSSPLPFVQYCLSSFIRAWYWISLKEHPIAAKAVLHIPTFAARLKSCPFKTGSN